MALLRNGRTQLEVWSYKALTCGNGGGERTRTADFYVANVALYQLSYTPEGPFRVPKHPSQPA